MWWKILNIFLISPLRQQTIYNCAYSVCPFYSCVVLLTILSHSVLTSFSHILLFLSFCHIPYPHSSLLTSFAFPVIIFTYVHCFPTRCSHTSPLHPFVTHIHCPSFLPVSHPTNFSFSSHLLPFIISFSHFIYLHFPYSPRALFTIFSIPSYFDIFFLIACTLHTILLHSIDSLSSLMFIALCTILSHIPPVRPFP